jgi:transposase
VGILFAEDGLMAKHHLHWNPGDTIAALAVRYHREVAPDLQIRWHALWLLRRGLARDEVADLLDVHPRTLRDWIAWYQQGGCAEIARHRSGGRQGQSCRLSLEQEAELAAWAETGIFHAIADVQHWVADYWGIDYTYWGMRSLLDRLKIHAKVPRPRAVHADLAVQAAWKKGAHPSAEGGRSLP